jgi:metallo-beta-lactamase family protein
VERQKRIKIFGEDYDLRARVESLSGMSGHADRSELIEWASHFNPATAPDVLVHGEPEAAFELAERLRTQLDFPQVTVPELGERFTL